MRLGLLLPPPLSWLLLAYLGSLAVLFVAAFWRLDPFTAEVGLDYGFQNFRQLWESDVYRAITQRTVLIAAAVTVTDALLAFPIAFYMAKVASPRTRNLLVVAILLPLWASYLVKVYAWRVILQEEGVLNWALMGLAQLERKGRFSQPGTAAEAIAALHDLASPVRAFLRDRCVIGTGCEVLVDDLYQAYRDWAEGNGQPKIAKTTLGRNLRAVLPRLRVSQPRTGGKQRRVYEGLRLKGANE